MRITIFGLLLAIILTNARTFAADGKDIVFANFEGQDYGDWKTEGEAFGQGPAQGTLPSQMPVTGYAGHGLASSFHGGDKSVGTLMSTEFTIERRYISFLIGGGGWEGKTCMNLLVDGKAVLTATGPNVKPGGSEELSQSGWDVAMFHGKQARLEIVDRAAGGWGHISVDQIVFTDQAPKLQPKLLSDVSRELTAEHRWLWFPIRSSATHRHIKVLVDGRVERIFDAELADFDAAWWSPLELSDWHGKHITLQIDHLPEGSTALTALHQTDVWEHADELYHEALRPQFHFSARRGWLNDPNGLVYYHGEYHMFFQHSPFSWHGGVKQWGHAVSNDLVHWEEISEALWADDFGPMWSGSAVVDTDNATGFGRDGKPPLVLIYTAAGQPFTQCIAYSNDGRTFTKYDKNPVVKNVSPGNRDPKVMRYDKDWVMTFYAGLPSKKLDEQGHSQTQHTIQFYTSKNLRDWRTASVTDGGIGNDHFLYECPDFFRLPINGEKHDSRWLLTAADAEFAVGGFDGKTFTALNPHEKLKKFGPRSHGYYAAQTFSDEPTGRRIQIAWLQFPGQGMPFNQSMSVPMELSLHETSDGMQLARWPVRELEQLRSDAHQLEAATKLVDGKPVTSGPCPDLFDLEATIDVGMAKEISFDIRGTHITYDTTREELVCEGYHAPTRLTKHQLKLRILGDRGVLEIFASDGLTYVPLLFTPPADNHTLSASAAGGDASVASWIIYSMASTWPGKLDQAEK